MGGAGGLGGGEGGGGAVADMTYTSFRLRIRLLPGSRSSTYRAAATHEMTNGPGPGSVLPWSLQPSPWSAQLASVSVDTR